MGKKLLQFMCALMIVLTLVLTGAASAWAKDTAQLDYEDIAARIPKENKNMGILQRSLPILVSARDDLRSAQKESSSYQNSLRELYGSLDAIAGSADSELGLLASVTRSSLMLSTGAAGSYSLDSINMSIEQMKIQIPQTEATLINGGQQLFVSYHQLQDAIKKMQANRVLLEESLGVAKTQLNAGLGTTLAVKEAELTIAELDTSIKQMESQSAQILNNLKIIAGWPQEQVMRLGAIPRPNREFLGKIKLADDIKTAQNNSYSLKLKQAEYKYTDDEDDSKVLIKLEMDALPEQISLKVSTQYYKITEANNTLLLEEERLTVAEEKVKQARLQNQLGLMSEIVLQSEETSYTSQKDAVISAMDSLFWEIENYKAIVAGLN